ncbi:MAG: aminotransferase class IV [Verrucomicrobiales bacterium]|nr:aminotransferase class IV [Verrucomicrobiales bacterium]MCP5525662.1 aminotransferase class IV [Verrucomicrobiales bacterium]
MSNQQLVHLGDRFVPAAEASLSVDDRGFLYGDGLFETMRVRAGHVPFWREHVERLVEGAMLLRLRLPWSTDDLRERAASLLAANGVRDGLLRVQVTRGPGRRGYSPKGADRPTGLLTTHRLALPVELAPMRVVVIASPAVWSGSPLNRVKHSSKLAHVLARAEADDRMADEALLLNERGEVVEASAANLFWISDDHLLTPPLASGALPGITRRTVIRAARALDLPVGEPPCTLGALREATGIFLTNSARGLVELGRLDGREVARSDLVGRLRAAWEKRLMEEGAP